MLMSQRYAANRNIIIYMQTIHVSYTNIRTSSKLKKRLNEDLKTFVTGLLMTNSVFILVRISQNLFFLQVNREQRI